VGQDYEPPGGPWALIFELLAMTAGAAVILLMLRWLGLAIPLLHQIGLA
jgi:hypothetical protein